MASRTYEPLGPDSLTWRYYGDARIILLGTWMVLMHSMWPPLGAAIEQQSDLLNKPIHRAARSMADVMAVVYGRDVAAVAGRRIRDYHRGVSAQIGDDSQVSVPPGFYHSMEPRTFYWAHACFFMAMLFTADKFCDGLSEAQCRQLFDEHVRWYAQYGVTMRPVPSSWDEFLAYWEGMAANLCPTPTTQALLAMSPPGLSGYLAGPALRGARWIAAGCMPDPVRRQLLVSWTGRDERRLRRLGAVVATVSRWLPDRVLLHPIAYAAMHPGHRKGRVSEAASVLCAWTVLAAAAVLR
jgi:uncharacterized protein (DUF2236 family)